MRDSVLEQSWLAASSLKACPTSTLRECRDQFRPSVHELSESAPTKVVEVFTRTYRDNLKEKK